MNYAFLFFAVFPFVFAAVVYVANTRLKKSREAKGEALPATTSHLLFTLVALMFVACLVGTLTAA